MSLRPRSLFALATTRHPLVRHATVQTGPQSTNGAFKIDLPNLSGAGPFGEVPKFEVIGSPFSLLNASIPAEAVLYTRRGTLVGINGDAKNLTSTLSIFNSGFLGTVSRAVGGLPFIYQKLRSSDPFTALIGTQSTATSFAVLELDGRLDWNITGKQALIAWSGVQASVKQENVDGSILQASTHLTGRGSAVVAGQGQIYQLVLQATDQYVVHPSHVIGYGVSCPRPMPVSLKFVNISLPLKLPSLSNWLLRYEFFRVMAKTDTWSFMKSAATKVRLFFRRVVHGSSAYVRFTGPTTLLLQSRTNIKFGGERDVVEAPMPDVQGERTPSTKSYAGSLKIASVENGRVTLEDTPDLSSFKR
ncbi:mitochondrial biogenesis AIM24-domain-containing protein [Protomyces lactucae-debilis]|uniref:Altered inheritance of mitochondria protein 24, mitochondrial n=1 Tax=Protomyces lactucae-debilis TaxID=2754530 RepID=A0A1Y2F2H2_PROLT|nr:mitochondrial biogenesis AIM24-domain-containing protein [Protomyces lactucae-debilis]ORY77684.1 mitochondrial biogenesis AIM24-domain-containing protein [Protomyces lactucae-debilis]